MSLPDVGDWAFVLRDHCGHSGRVGVPYRVLELAEPQFFLRCPSCNVVFATGALIARLDFDGPHWIPHHWLRRIPPLDESAEQREEICA